MRRRQRRVAAFRPLHIRAHTETHTHTHTYIRTHVHTSRHARARAPSRLARHSAHHSSHSDCERLFEGALAQRVQLIISICFTTLAECCPRERCTVPTNQTRRTLCGFRATHARVTCICTRTRALTLGQPHARVAVAYARVANIARFQRRHRRKSLASGCVQYLYVVVVVVLVALFACGSLLRPNVIIYLCASSGRACRLRVAHGRTWAHLGGAEDASLRALLRGRLAR